MKIPFGILTVRVGPVLTGLVRVVQVFDGAEL